MDGGDNFSTRGGRRTPTRPVQHPDPADVIRQEEVEELLQIFLEYCSYGSSYYGEELSDARFVRFCRDMGILGATSRQRGLLPQLDVDLIFIQAKPKYYKKMSFEGFCKALYLLSDKLGVGFPELMHQAIEMGGPRPTERAARNYMQAEAPVFAMDSRLRGFEVSDDPHTKNLTLKEMVRPEFVPKPVRKPRATPPPEMEAPKTVPRRQRMSPKKEDAIPEIKRDIDVLSEMSRRAKARSGLSTWQVGQSILTHGAQPEQATLPILQTPPAAAATGGAAAGAAARRQSIGSGAFEAALRQHELHRQQHEHRAGRARGEIDENDYEGGAGHSHHPQQGMKSPVMSKSVPPQAHTTGSKTPEQKTIGRYKDPAAMSLTPPSGPRPESSNVYMRLLGSYRS